MMNFKTPQYAKMVISAKLDVVMFNDSVQIFEFQTKGASNAGQIEQTAPNDVPIALTDSLIE